MAKHVFILGAGASFDAGAPLMKEFVDRARALKHLLDQSSWGLFTNVFESLHRAHSKATLDLLNIESLLGAIDTARIADCLPDLGCGDGRDVLRAVKLVIAGTLEHSVKFDLGAQGDHRPPQTLRRFARNVLIPLAQRGESVAVISFNYDVALDHALHHSLAPIDYGISTMLSLESGSTQFPVIPLLKLHGSLNWSMCPQCNLIDVLTFPACRKVATTEAGQFLFSKLINTRSPCGKDGHEAEPALVPPTYNKLHYASLLGPVWKRAASEFRDAECVYVIGYSLPETDNFFRYLFAVGSIGHAVIERLEIVDIDVDVKQRFVALLGPMTRPRLLHRQTTFASAVGDMETRVQKMG